MRTLFGAVCDVSVLSNRASFERAKWFLDGGELYLPSPTYAWLAREKAIAVRNEIVSYTLVSQLVRDRQLLIIFLPELLDELSRRMLFEIEHEVPLTDLRALMLAAHLRLPFLTFTEEPIERFRKRMEIQLLWRLDVPNRSIFYKVLELYRELMNDAKDYLCRNMSNEPILEKLTDELRRRRSNKLKAITFVTRKLGKANPENLSFEYMAWNIMPFLHECLEQRILVREVVYELCDRALLLIASPAEKYPTEAK